MNFIQFRHHHHQQQHLLSSLHFNFYKINRHLLPKNSFLVFKVKFISVHVNHSKTVSNQGFHFFLVYLGGLEGFYELFPDLCTPSRFEPTNEAWGSRSCESKIRNHPPFTLEKCGHFNSASAVDDKSVSGSKISISYLIIL